MTDYTKTTDFAAKDSLPSGDSGKVIRGSEFETEFDNIATAVATKSDTASPTFTGTVTIPTLSVSGNTTLGDDATDTVTFTADIASNVIPSADNTYDLGSSSAEWKDLYIDGTAYIDNVRPSFINIDDAPNKISFGDDSDLEIYHEPDVGGFIDCTLDGGNIYNRALYVIAEPLILNHGSTNNEVLQTTSTGISVTSISLGDNNKAIFGAGSDLQIYHSGTASHIKENGSGSLFIDGTNIRLRSSAEEIYLEALSDGAVSIYYDNVSKLATTSTGIAVTGVTDTDQLRVTTPTVPASATASGTAGDIAWDADYIYVCTATNTWKRVAISTWT